MISNRPVDDGASISWCYKYRIGQRGKARQVSVVEEAFVADSTAGHGGRLSEATAQGQQEPLQIMLVEKGR
jgi:hypothetical protein